MTQKVCSNELEYKVIFIASKHEQSTGWNQSLCSSKRKYQDSKKQDTQRLKYEVPRSLFIR